ncbi:MAG: GntR family transcriptional regulator [Lentisphaerota bacterium]
MPLVKKETSMEIAYNRILQKIINERMNPGTPLREDHLAKEFGFSSTPVREAFRRLEHEGWIQSFPYKGSFLKNFTTEEVKDLYLLREAIECIAVSQAIEKATAKDWAKIADALRMEKEYIAAPERDGNETMPSLSPDIDFHNAIVCAAHSSLLLYRNNTLRAQLNCIYLSSRIKTTHEELIAVYDEHSMIYQSMRRGWGNIAEDLIRRHISSARIKYLKQL